MDQVKLRSYEALGPFEIKNELAALATATAEASAISSLNAGRGNPNWIATEPREAFFLLGQFAITESKRVMDLPPGVGGMPQKAGVEKRRVPYVTRAFENAPGPVVAACDYVRLVPEMVSRWMPRPFTPLGTDGFGRSDTRAGLRSFFAVDAAHIVDAALSALGRPHR